MEGIGRYPESCSITPCVTLLRQHLAFSQKLGRQQASPSHPPVSVTTIGLSMQECLAFYMHAWGSKLRSSCSGRSTLTRWVISPPPVYLSDWIWFLFYCFVLNMSQVAQADLKLTTEPRMTLNPSSSCLHLWSARMIGTCYQAEPALLTM